MNEDSDDLETIDPTVPSVPVAASPTLELPASWPAGWYADPWTAGQYRYWSGQTWTGETHRWGPANVVRAPGAAGTTTDPWPALGSPMASGYGWPAVAARDVAPAAAPRRPRGPIVAGVVALVVVLVASGAVGYAINSSSQPERAVRLIPSPTITAPSTTQPAGSSGRAAAPDPDRGVLGGLGVQQADVGPARTVLLIPDGNRLTKATLDLCNGTFASERLRTARLQVVDVNARGVGGLSTEAVLYRNAAAAERPFAELRQVRASCPHAPVPSPVGEPTIKTVFKGAPDGSWPHTPTVERQAYSTVITEAGNTRSSVAVYLRRGRALLGLYFARPNVPQPAVAGQRSIERIVGVFEARMAKLPASVG